MAASESTSLRARQPPWLQPAIGAALFAAAGWVLHHELHEVGYAAIVAAYDELPARALLLALLLTGSNYAVLTGFDLLAFRHIGKRVAVWRIALASFVGYAISNGVGFALLSGTSARYRFYSRWGVSAGELSRIFVFYSGTFWLGLLVLGGWVLAFRPHPSIADGTGGTLVRLAGLALLAISAAYAVSPLLLKRPVRLRGRELRVPPGRTVALQYFLSILDWLLAAGVVYALLPAGLVGYGEVLGAFMAAQLLGLLSNVPGGLGVFEGTMLLLLGDRVETQVLLSSLVLFRVVYYLVPLLAALAVLIADEARQRRAQVARLGGAFGALAFQLVPKVLAVFVFLAGAILLFSGATPTELDRIRWLSRVFPLAVFEASHFLGSVVGVGLLIVSHGIARRLDGAYYAAAGLLAAGVAFSLLKGADFEAATVLLALLALLLPTRAHFDRRSAFWRTRFSPGWATAVVAVVGASVWLGLFAFRHVEYSDALWWHFELRGDAPRSWRASVGATIALFAFGVVRLLRPAPPEVSLPGPEEIEEAARVIDRQRSTHAFLALLGDKVLLWNEARTGFLMYGVQGRTWVALGDPVAAETDSAELVRRFVERADDFGAQPVFYQVSRERLHEYADFGLTFVKLGEEARVPLTEFTVEGGRGKGYRRVLNQVERDGARFRVLQPAEVEAAIPQLKAISDAWLGEKAGSEKGFSLGYFDADYLRRLPVAVLERDGRVVAFANLWPGPNKVELSVDLMRFGEDAPDNSMEALFLHLMIWGKAEGYRWFNLGMAPLSGLASSPVAPLWAKFGRTVYMRGRRFYNFQGLRSYKDKFHPTWESRYLAYPGGLALPRILADVSALIAGGYRRILQ